MKKFLLFAFLLACFSGFSQTTKGRFIVSGAAGLQVNAGTIKYEYDGEDFGDTKQTTIQFTPSFGYFVIDNLAVGLSSSISSTTQKDDGDKYTSTSIAIAPTVIYFFPVEGKIKPFVQVAAGLNNASNKYVPNEGPDEKESYSGLLLSGGGGVAFFINDNVSFNAGLTYNRSSLKDSDDDNYKVKQGILSGSVGISVFL
jgi:outer membrane protein